jgi:flagellar motor switch protein FliN/FliY
MTAQPATASTAELAEAAAALLAQNLPTPLPLTPAAADPGALPTPDTVAVRAGFVGAMSAELVVALAEPVANAIGGADGLSLVDVLRPALEAAGQALGSGVLDAGTVGPVADALVGDGVGTIALVDSLDTPLVWFGLHVRTPQGGGVPHQRSQVATPGGESAALRLLHDVEMTLTAEIGRTKLPVRQVLELVPGTVLELDRAAGAPADVLVNGRLVARGEVVVVDEDYGIRITEIVTETL